MLYLGLCLGPYSILVTAGLGGVYIYSYCSYCGGSCGGYCFILSIAGLAIGTTSGTAVEIAGRINRGSYGDFYRCYYRRYCGGCYRGSCRGYYGGDIGLVGSWWLPLGL